MDSITLSEGLSFEAWSSAVNFSGLNGIWDSVSNTGVTPVDQPPGTLFTSTLVKGSDEYLFVRNDQ